MKRPFRTITSMLDMLEPIADVYGLKLNRGRDFSFASKIARHIEDNTAVLLDELGIQTQ